MYQVYGRAKTKTNTKKRKKENEKEQQKKRTQEGKKIKMKNGAKSFGQLDIFRVAKIILGKEKAPWLD
jgi:hypothetical protein